ncbi:MAG: FAD-binding oxidoreductase, partial [Gammaproteobacteria bacterium]
MPDSTAEIFAEIVGRDNILTDTGDCLTYGYDNSRRQAQPAIVVFPTDAEQVREIVIKCNELKLPLLARGRATATTGATVPVDGAAVISFEKMNRIIRIDTDNRLAVVEPGVTNQELQNALAEKGF